jgi:LPXTG-site transpeptidase (sortase) family protein
MGHYPDTQMPGQLGNMAIAGHRNGYGQPLGDVDKLQSGDPIVLRTKDYWYVYRYTTNKIVLPEQVDVIAPNPEHPGQQPTARMITLTTCEPKYSTPTHRWISHGELAYWAKGSDGIPKELSATDGSGAVRFVNNQTQSPMSKLSSLVPVMRVALLCYLVLFIAAAAAWRWPARRAIREGRVRRPAASIYGSILRLQPGVAPVRFLLLLILLVVAAAALLQWGFPWAATTIPYLRSISSFVTV